MLNDAQVHLVLARCLVDPGFLQCIENGEATDLAGLDESTMRQFRAVAPQIRKYAGLIATVQNNGLWQYIPATRILLKRYNLDLKTFVAFREQHQANRARGGISRDSITQTFFSFLESLVSTNPEYRRPMLPEVFGHERQVWEMQRLAVPPVASTPSLSRSAVGAMRPVINGLLRLAKYPIDPIGAAERLVAGEPDVPDPAATTIGYWRDPGDHTLTILTMTEATADLLLHVDGRTTIDELVASAVAKYGAEAEDVSALLDAWRERGMLLAADDTVVAGASLS
jgi:hypothetical protein